MEKETKCKLVPEDKLQMVDKESLENYLIKKFSNR